MNGILHIPYVNTEYDEEKYNYNGREFDYISKLDDVGNTIIGGQSAVGYISRMSNNSIGFNANFGNGIQVDEGQILFYQLPCVFMNENGQDISIGELINHFKNKDFFMLSFSFDHENTDEDCLVELKSWVSESKKVMDVPDNYFDRDKQMWVNNEELKMSLYPRRQFKMSIGKVKAFLNECVFFDSNEDKITIYVNEIIFYN